MKIFLCASEQDVSVSVSKPAIAAIESKHAEPVLMGQQVQSENGMLDMDGCVLDAGCPAANVAYALAFATLQQRPILMLYRDQAQLDELLMHVDRSQVEHILLTRKYTELDDVRGYVESFLDERVIPAFNAQHAPSIKFTLRITPRLDQLLTLRAKEEGISKADFLRKKMEDMLGESLDTTSDRTTL